MWQVYVLDSSTMDPEPELLKTVNTLDDAVDCVVREYILAHLALPKQCPPIHQVAQGVPYSSEWKWNEQGAFFRLQPDKKVVPIAAIYYPGIGSLEHYALRKPNCSKMSMLWCCGCNAI